ncbi:hypothetical protein MMC30_005877 [Trapelia coarctata]|nr:hypothetical protein [Trapelia coarctata]
MAEAAGLTLAVIPLLISAVENYEVLFRPFVTYSRYAKEAERFASQLKAQKTAFRNECHLLLSSVCDQPQEVDTMLLVSNHPLHSDMEIDRRIRELLDSSYDTCMSTLKLIHDTLEEIGEETKGFSALIGSKFENTGRARRYLIRQKLKISFSKPRLIDTINNLRSYNQDFCMLSRQIGRLDQEGRTVRTNPRPAQKQAARYFGNIQEASKRLHHALSNSWSCETHTEHSASICLDIAHAGGPQMVLSAVRFDLIVTSPISSVVSTEETLWLTIESASEEPDDSGNRPLSAIDGPLTTLTASLKDAALGPKPKSVAFVLPPAPGEATRADHNYGCFSKMSQETRKMVDLCSVQNLCLYFRQQLQMSTLSLNSPTCVGFLQKTKTFKHYVYPTPCSSPGNHRNSLHDALVLARNSQDCIPVEDKLRLAKVLAMAVLQFHATPWLRDNWRSTDVHFFAVEEGPLTQGSLRAPHLESNLAQNKKAISSSPQRSLCFAPNSTLFSLGVILLELGFDAPLSSLRQESDLKDGQETPYTEFLTASRLKKIVGTRLGARYERLVTKCLHCDFGLGSSELDSPEVQNAFFQDVVCELNVCLNAATKF